MLSTIRISVTLPWFCTLQLHALALSNKLLPHAYSRSLSTLNYWFFLELLEDFEKPGNRSRFCFPSDEIIRSQCSHFVEEDAKSQFCDLVLQLWSGPQRPQKAWNFAESLLKTHAFFLPLRTEPVARHVHDHPHSDQSFSPSFSPSDDVSTISNIFGFVDPSPNSVFQHLFASLAKLNRQMPNTSASETCRLLGKISSDVNSSNPVELSDKIRFGALDELMRTLHAHPREFSVVRQVLHVMFQILDACPCQRHVLMQITHVERETGVSLLQYLVRFVCSKGLPAATYTAADGADIMQQMITSALKCIKSIVSSSIPYNSLRDFPNSGCYGDPKMGSMLTAKVLQSILIAVQAETASELFEFLKNPENHCDSADTDAVLRQLSIFHPQDLQDVQHTDAKLSAVAACLRTAAATKLLHVMHHLRSENAKTWNAREIGARALQAFAGECDEDDPIFCGNRRVFWTMIRQDSTVREFSRLNELA
jgi:hypothetical protein